MAFFVVCEGNTEKKHKKKKKTLLKFTLKVYTIRV